MEMSQSSSEYFHTMRDITRHRILNDLFARIAASTSSWMILIMDKEATAVISSNVGMYDIMEHRISTVENLLNDNRATFPDLEAVYVINPSVDSIRLVSADFQSEKKAKYAAAHLYFLSRASQQVMRCVQENPVLLGRVRTLQEINLFFKCPEAQVFDLSLPFVLHELYGQNLERSPIVQKIVERLVTVCLTLNEFPHVRYNRESPVGSIIANSFQNAMSQAIQANRDWWFHGSAGHTDRERGVLLVLDRGQDAVYPFLHDFTYQAVVYDLLKVDDDTVSFQTDTPQGTIDKVAVLGENDALWVEMRHQHLAHVVNAVRDRVNDFMQTNAGARAQGVDRDNLSMTDVSEALRALPQYREVVGRLTSHLKIAQQCMDKFQTEGLLEVIELEQTIVTGTDTVNQKVSRATMLEMVTDIVQRPNISPQVKARILGAFFITQIPISNAEKSELYRISRLDGAYQDALDNLTIIGVDFAARIPKVKKGMLSRIKGAIKKLSASNIYGQGQEFTSTRYHSQIEDIIEKMANNALPFDQFPSVVPMPQGNSQGGNEADGISVRKAQKSKYSETKGQQRAFGGARQLVFFAGGCTYSEMRAGYEISKQTHKEIILGGTSLLTPAKYISELEDASSGAQSVQTVLLNL